MIRRWLSGNTRNQKQKKKLNLDKTQPRKLFEFLIWKHNLNVVILNKLILLAHCPALHFLSFEGPNECICHGGISAESHPPMQT
jgi:hypothetical protein